jgi:hypothetical protein
MPENFGLVNRFHVEIGGLDLGHWATCKGLEVHFDTTEIKGGAVYDEPLLFPERLTYKSWTLPEAYPKVWKGPQFDANTAGVALETLVLAHTGFLL